MFQKFVVLLGLGWVGASISALKEDPTGDTVYVFAYSWQPEFCYDEPYPGCDDPETYWETHFTVHGLWPQYTEGGYPADCSTEALNTTVFDVIGMDTMTEYWPNVQDEEYESDGDINPEYYSFWEHEWSKHGTCSGLSQYDYFDDTINLIKQFGTPSSVSAAAGGDPVSADDLRDDFGGAAKCSLQCENSQYLVGVYTCWDHDSDGHPTSQIDCPSDVVAEDTCTHSTVTVPAFEDRRRKK